MGEFDDIKANEQPLFEQKENIELTLNAKGQYQWKIKILSLDVEQLAKIDKELRNKFVEDKK